MKISQQKQNKISEQILGVLFEKSPKTQFTAHIAAELARDEEFIKRLLLNLKNKKLVTEIKKNPSGIEYKRRQRWTLSKPTYEHYKKLQN